MKDAPVFVDESMLDKGAGDLLFTNRPFGVVVYVAIWEEHVLFEVRSFQTVGSLKRDIERKTKIPADKQLLLCGLTPMNKDDTPLAHYGFVDKLFVVHDQLLFLAAPLQPNTSLEISQSLVQSIKAAAELMPIVKGIHPQPAGLPVEQYLVATVQDPSSESKIQIFVNIANEKYIITLNVEPTDTIGSLKPMIQEHVSIDAHSNLLVFKDVNLLEKESSTLEECGVKDKDSLLLCRNRPFGIKVYVYYWDVNMLLVVESLQTVGYLKKKIEQVTEIAVDKQYLLCGSNPMDKDEIPLVHYGFVKPLSLVHNQLLELSPKPGDVLELRKEGLELMSITLQEIPDSPEADCVLVRVPESALMLMEIPWSLLKSAKQAAADGVPVEQFVDTVQESSNCKIFVEIPISEHVNLHITLNAKLTDTVGTVKTQIGRRACDDKGVSMACIRGGMHELLFDGKLLKYDSTLYECGIRDRDRLLFCWRGCFEVIISMPYKMNGRELSTIEVESFDSIGKVKAKIYQAMGILPEKQLLSYHKRWLVDDARQLVDYGIVKHTSQCIPWHPPSYMLQLFPRTAMSPSPLIKRRRLV